MDVQQVSPCHDFSLAYWKLARLQTLVLFSRLKCLYIVRIEMFLTCKHLAIIDLIIGSLCRWLSSLSAHLATLLATSCILQFVGLGNHPLRYRNKINCIVLYCIVLYIIQHFERGQLSRKKSKGQISNISCWIFIEPWSGEVIKCQPLSLTAR